MISKQSLYVALPTMQPFKPTRGTALFILTDWRNKQRLVTVRT